MMNPKYVLVNEIEERLNITLTNEQLTYIFSEDKELIATTPRKYGKDFMTAIKIAIHLILKDNYKIGVLCSNHYATRYLYEQIKDILELLNANNQMQSCNKNLCRILMNNNSEVNVFSSNSNIRGYRLDEAYIIEFLHKQGMQETINTMLSCLLHKTDYRLNIIGTLMNTLIIDDVLNRPNIKHIQVRRIESILINGITVCHGFEEMPEFANPGEMIFNSRTNEPYVANQFGEFVRCSLQ